MNRCIAGVIAWLVIGTAGATPEVGLPTEPALSPDGSMIAFVWAGDLWAVPAGGGEARRITAHPANETTPAFSPDGSMLAFESDRDGARNLYVVDFDANMIASQPRRVTASDRSQSLSGFSTDGQALLFSGRLDPAIYRHDRMYRVPIEGGPVRMITPAFGKQPMQAGNGQIVFTRGYGISNRPNYRGSGSMDVWRFDPANDSFTQLTLFGGNDMQPAQLADGSVLFLSSRSGQNNIHRLAAGTTDDQPGVVAQLTNFAPKAGEVTIAHGVRDLAVSADGSTAAFVVWDTLYTLDLANATATPQAVHLAAISDDALADTQRIDVSKQASEVAMHPSGKAIALVARGEIYVRSTEDDRPARRVTQTHARERHLAWSPDGEKLYFTVDDEQSLGSIFAAKVTLSKDDLKPPSEDEDDGENEIEDEAIDSGESEDSLPSDSPDAEATKADGADDEDAGDDEEGEDADDEKKTDAPKFGERWADALTFEFEPVVVGQAWDTRPKPSPDGKTLLTVRGRGDLILHDLATGSERVLLESWNEPEAFWLSDSQHIVYELADLDFNSDIWLMDTAVGDDGTSVEPINLTRHPDIDTSPRISHDGKVLTFLSDRDNNNWDYDVYAVYLDRSLEGLRAYDLDAYFEEAAKAAKKLEPLVIEEDADTDDKDTDDEDTEKDADQPEALSFDADDAYLRIRRMTRLAGSEGDLAITPGGDRIIFEASIDGDTSLFSIDHKGKDRKTIESGGVSNVNVSLTGEQVVYLDGGTAKAASPMGSKKKTYSISAEITVDIATQQRQKFLEGARTFGEFFYHPTLKGLDWPGLTRRYAALAERTRTSNEFNAVFTLMLGEVDGSHTGIRGGGGFSAKSPGTGYMGIDFTPAPNGYRVTRVLTDGPADLGELGLGEDNVLIAINDQPIVRDGQLRDLVAAMIGTARKETLLEVQDAQGVNRFILLTPHSYGSENNLRYNDETRTRRETVERLSDGKLGYLHIRGMSMPSVRDFERDLYAAAHGKQGLVIDVRDNGGGFTTDILLASLTAPAHAYTIPRGADPKSVPTDSYPRDRRLIYGWSRPINVLINQHSFSNAEIFAHAIKTTDRGTIVGTATFGGVISTGSFRLIDGTTIRRPFRGWYTAAGKDMDVFPAVPDVSVAQTPADEVAGRDAQLEAAVTELLGRIDE